MMSVTMAPFTSRVSTTLPGSASERRLGRRAPCTLPRLPVWVEREEEVSLNLLPVFPTAPPRITSEFSVPARSLAGSGGRLRPAKQVGLPPNALITGSLDCGSAVGLRSSGPRLAATPYPVDYPAQERSARTRLSLVRPPKGQTYLTPCFSTG